MSEGSQEENEGSEGVGERKEGGKSNLFAFSYVRDSVPHPLIYVKISRKKPVLYEFALNIDPVRICNACIVKHSTRTVSHTLEFVSPASRA